MQSKQLPVELNFERSFLAFRFKQLVFREEGGKFACTYGHNLYLTMNWTVALFVKLFATVILRSALIIPLKLIYIDTVICKQDVESTDSAA